MATDLRGHTVPAGNEAPARASLTALALSVRDPIPVANATARAQAITDLAAVGVTASTANPIFFFRGDAPPGARLEETTDGTTFRTYRAGGVTVSGTMIGTYSGQALDTKYVTGTVDMNPSGDFIAMTAAEYGSGGIVWAEAHAAGNTLDLIYTPRMVEGSLLFRVYNTAGAIVTLDHSAAVKIKYWTA